MAGASDPSSRNGRWSLKGKTALVTGGTKGIGYAIVEELAEFGARVHTCSRNQIEINERIKEWESKGYSVSGSVCDLTCREQRAQLMATVSLLFNGKLNILVNNAGTYSMKKAVDYSSEDYAVLMGLNFETPFHLCQIAHPLLKASGNGSIVFISSVAGGKALPQLSVYAASKGAINQLTRNLAYEWAKDNIRTNAVSPWAVNTTISEGKPRDRDMEVTKEFIDLMSRTPIQRIAEPNETSPLVAFLCLPVASYINGQVINVDGGFTAV
ncbi:unnamed protein product [Rhodiola kirilowii]